ncbi:putative homolog of CLP1 of Coprinus cinereus and of Schizophyllum commune [Lyophyllum shimeji]|uniref:Homolog of CLP1 of Coprinus cinereus and of Schizophyllum commune n=1 Tax=Lyophyllum shimeji TaxID=47721 RepID=A0A9P3PQW6_LYOSH|nr:putative homolog of CLP1 of Coprinus cinereus and of Schizophyllum commune [Lyophyllum shimeji]
MFQVASHPTAFDTPAYVHSHRRSGSSAAPQSPAVQLPRTLARPPFAEVSRDAITAVAPELANVPAEYIRRGLRPRANEMLAGMSALAPSHMPSSMPRSRLPASLSIPLRATSGPQPSYPTHVLAVTSSKNPSDQAMLFPVHSLVLASQCAQLPRLPPSHQQPHSPTLQLPVLPLSIPSPAAFTILRSFMYDHRLESVLKALFPVPSSFLQSLSHEKVQAALASGSTLHQLSSYLCSSASSNLHTLTTHAMHVKELWQDMVALGLHDPELWDTLDLAWEVVLGALNLAAAGN